ncbi:ubiquitin conjugating enzyme 9 [Hibiscus trionum]|uniref:Ubiquitin conjugating enzyme 9 n=1 Tax=Hibiscus trionum TaxID=183268 RepID=A0A9W7I0P5_HIBTR|nr:ubiquitin conjugating enzyme 9 [Hibiscus trionum]
MAAPEGNPFEGHTFFLPDYPMRPPRFVFRFHGSVFHPNFSEIGGIRLDILQERWSPDIRVVEILARLLGLLRVPNLDDAHPNCEGIALIYRNNPQRFARYVRRIFLG